MPDLFKSNEGKKALESQQRRSLAQFAQQQGEIDQAAAAGAGTGRTRNRGRGLLTFLLSGDGQATLG